VVIGGRVERVGELDKGGQNVQTSGYKIKNTGDVMYNMMTMVTLLYSIFEIS